MTAKREADIKTKLERWRVHQLVMQAAGLVAVPRNDLERTFVRLQKQVDQENATAERAKMPCDAA